MAGPHDARLRLVPGGVGSTVEVGGERLRGLRAVKLEQGLHDLAVLTVEVRLFEVDAESVGTVVQVPEDTAETLVALGWTPPGRLDEAIREALDDAEYDRTHGPAEDD